MYFFRRILRNHFFLNEKKGNSCHQKKRHFTWEIMRKWGLRILKIKKKRSWKKEKHVNEQQGKEIRRNSKESIFTYGNKARVFWRGIICQYTCRIWYVKEDGKKYLENVLDYLLTRNNSYFNAQFIYLWINWRQLN